MVARPYPEAWFDYKQTYEMASTDPEFGAFFRSVSNYLATMSPDKQLRLDRYQGKKLEWVVRSVVCYIHTWSPQEHLFTDDYQAVTRTIATPPDVLKAMFQPPKKKA